MIKQNFHIQGTKRKEAYTPSHIPFFFHVQRHYTHNKLTLTRKKERKKKSSLLQFYETKNHTYFRIKTKIYFRKKNI